MLERRNLNIQMLLHVVCAALYLYQVCAGEHKLGEAHFTRTPLPYREPQLMEQENYKATHKGYCKRIRQRKPSLRCALRQGCWDISVT